MRVVNVSCPIRNRTRVLERLTGSRMFVQFHGPTTRVGPWESGKRHIRFDIDSADSPIPLPSSVCAAVVQEYDGLTGVITNSMRLRGFPNLLGIESTWTCTDTELVARARIAVRVPPPLRWLAEHFVARKAQVQMDAFAEFVSRAEEDHGVEGH